MRGVLILIVIVLVLILLGWITFRTNGNQATVTIEKEKIKADTHEMVEKGNEAVENIENSIHKKENAESTNDEPLDSTPSTTQPVSPEPAQQ